jgi:hypothetical protein
VQRALNRLGVPGREDLVDLSARVDALTGELRKLGGKPAAKAADVKVKTIKVNTIKTKTTPAAKAPARKAAKPAARKPAARKATRALPKAPRPVAP